MDIEGTTFGTITIDGKTYEHDVIIRLSGEVVKRKKKLSKKYYGVSRELLPVFPNQAQRAQPLALQGVTAAKLLRAAWSASGPTHQPTSG